MRVGYADQNGHPFRSIARVLIERGELTLDARVDAGDRARGAARNPDKLPALLDENPSYVFFREVPPPPPGSLDARDRRPDRRARRAAAGASARSPSTRARSRSARRCSSRRRGRCRTQPLQRLMLAQDTGGAIRGAVRADFFWGFGDEAGREAGRMRQEGRMWLLWPKDAPLP